MNVFCRLSMETASAIRGMKRVAVVAIIDDAVSEKKLRRSKLSSTSIFEGWSSRAALRDTLFWKGTLKDSMRHDETARTTRETRRRIVDIFSKIYGEEAKGGKGCSRIFDWNTSIKLELVTVTCFHLLSKLVS